MKYILTRLAIHLLIIAALAAAAIWGVNNWLKSYTRHGESVTVPEVVGVDAVDARSILIDAGLQVSFIDTVFAENVAPGAVVEQIPEDGLPVKSGRIVYLTVNSRSKQQKQMPDLSRIIGGPSRNAQSVLMQSGFRPDSIHYVAHEFDDEVLGVKTMDGRDVIENGLYDIHTRLILEVGTTNLEPEGETDEVIEGGWME